MSVHRVIFCSLSVAACFAIAENVRAQDYLVSPYADLQLANSDRIVALSFSSDDKNILLGTESGEIQCFNLERRTPLGSAREDNSPLLLAFMSDDREYLCVDDHGTVTIRGILDGNVALSFRTKAKPLSAALDAGKRYLAVATRDDKIELVDLKARMPSGSIDTQGKIDDMLFLGFDRLGQQLVAVMPNGDVVSWNPATLKLLRELKLDAAELHGSRTSIRAACTNRAANVFAVGLEEVAMPPGGIMSGKDLTRQNMVVAYDWNTGVEIKRMKLTWGIERVALGPGNDHIALTNDEDRTVSLLDLRKGEVGSSIAMDEKPVCVAVSESNALLAAGTANGKCLVWNIRFKGDPGVTASSLPSLSGRIRTRSGTEPALKRGEPVRLAILSFDAKGVPQEYADICLNSMSNGLANFDYVTLVERSKIESVVKEQQFQVSDLADEGTGVRVGKLLNVNNVLLCSIGRLGSSLILTARMLSVETGKVVKGREVICEECRDQDIYDAVSTLVSTIAQ